MKDFEKYVRAHIRQLKKSLKQYGSIPDAEVLHQIRVEVKKIKAAIQLIGDSKKKFKAHRKFLPFRTIFRKAEAIREADVKAETLIHYHLVSDSSPELEDQPEAQKSFTKDIPFFLQLIEKHGDKIITAAKAIGNKKLRKYIKKKNSELKKGIYPQLKTQGLHRMRKNAKSLIYLSSVNDCINKKDLRFLNHLENLVGHWHDKKTLLADKGIQQDDRKRLKTLCKEDIQSIKRLAVSHYK